MNPVLVKLARFGEIGWLSCKFAEFIAQQAKVEANHPLVYSAALVCEANRAGDVCVDLAQLSGRPYFSSSQIDAAEIPPTLDTDTWCQQLLASNCVGTPGQHSPLTLESSRLYLNRYWHYESSIAREVIARCKQQETGAIAPAKADSDRLDADQQAAIITAANRGFSVISGGPGSGKTSSVIRILSLLLARDPQSRIALAAPTGKAAARMMTSIRQGLEHSDLDDATRAVLPVEATTLHRLLEYRHHRYHYHRQRRLPVDCVVVDEASMIDIKLLFHLLEALPDEARLILLGDRDQLASVAAGNVLGDITGHGSAPSDSPIADSIALLRQSYRFDRDSAVGELAGLVNQGQASAAIDLLARSQHGLSWYDTDSEQIEPRVLAGLLEAYQAVLSSDSPQSALDAFASTRLLCATNHGPLGVDAVNRQISTALLARNQLAAGEQYHGLPIMIVHNHHELDLFNGDTGILWQTGNRLQACFADAAGGVRSLALNRLPEFVPAWASTVHKSQGSEFDSVTLLLPADAESPVLSRELLYTAITRARESFCLHGSQAAVGRAIDNLTRRHSGLAEKLGWAGAAA